LGGKERGMSEKPPEKLLKITLHIGDYLAETNTLGTTEHGANFLLLCAFYRSCKPLPLALNELCRIARAETKADRAAVTRVLEKFWTKQEDGYTHTIAQADIRATLAFHAKQKINGDQGGRPRKPKPK
jgi:uncharacterized protein YdaU (DUF1376 family)